MQIIDDILQALGITRNYRGYPHTAYALKLTVEDENRLRAVTKEIYFATAEHFHCHWTSVERNIRTVVQRVRRINPVLLDEMAGFHLITTPTNGEFLGIITAYIQKNIQPR